MEKSYQCNDSMCAYYDLARIIELIVVSSYKCADCHLEIQL